MPATFGYAPQKTFLPSSPSKGAQPGSQEEVIQRGRCSTITGGSEMDRKHYGWYGKKPAPENLNLDRSMGRYNTSNGMGMGVGQGDPGDRMFGPFSGVAGIG